ncbi:chloramphenicol acetyltransferase Cat [Gottschalkia acidurici 9a]|uniref:Chloramphenicol acetyltransferase Cat n=1 Tax=Gottschalkia acidurici (strain ATCC 7906 / DSM 604 / BCRC 14475 / CIP 104303 / KCTC 5404 / NCIMB 10678 / 9a) TaxID=1128398 RepID=K0AYD4_GOTA9|nr:CatA-like O-acetyltransferase [Gottschalkia acidurici]AFS77782.1 chloramphenicol acetyltransferase Cat [Gottschalkia acidurici 9a]
MEEYKVVDLKKFSRSEYYEYFMAVGTTFEMTVKIDVTKAVKKCKGEALSFYSYSIFNLTKAVNTIQNFKYDILNGQLIEWDKIIPTFTNFNQETKMFYTLWLDDMPDYQTFDKQFKKTVQTYSSSTGISPMVEIPSNVFNISSIPWTHFEQFSSNTSKIDDNLKPMITTGKYEEIDSKLLLPVTIKVHHATVDGYHVAMFFEQFQKEMNA